MATRETKLRVLLSTLGFDEAMEIAPTLTDDDADDGDAAEKAAAAEAAAATKAASTNPFVRGPHFSLEKQAKMYRDPKSRRIAISLARSAGLTLPDNPSPKDLDARYVNGG